MLIECWVEVYVQMILYLFVLVLSSSVLTGCAGYSLSASWFPSLGEVTSVDGEANALRVKVDPQPMMTSPKVSVHVKAWKDEQKFKYVLKITNTSSAVINKFSGVIVFQTPDGMTLKTLAVAFNRVVHPGGELSFAGALSHGDLGLPDASGLMKVNVFWEPVDHAVGGGV